MARYEDDDDDDGDDRPIKKKRRSSSGGGNVFVDFLTFRKMVGPWVLLVLYYLVVLILIGFGGFAVVQTLREAGRMPWQVTLLGVVMGLATMILGPIVYRVVFELMITVFRIYETLVEIRDNRK